MLLYITIYTFLGLLSPLSTNNTTKDYIEEHKNIAISEMHRTGIPASIKLAQALLESNYGKSELALSANNHFGMKCGNRWKGQTHYRKDDDYVNGKLVKSCFRKYMHPKESFIAHSDFLMDENKKYRYGFLFKYDKSDYESWAYGLYDAGYATDPNYPEKLIAIIEDNNLVQYDSKSASYVPKEESYSYEPRSYVPLDERKAAKAVKKETKTTVPATRKTYTTPQAEDKNVARAQFTAVVDESRYRRKEVNYVPLVIAKGNETLLEFTRTNGISLKDAIEYNERLNSSADILEENEYVYTREKKNNFVGNKETHKVKHGESMYDISQLYGIKLNSLYAKNRLPKYAQPLVGEKISLQGRVKLGDRPRFNDKSKDKRSDSKFLF